MIVKEVLRQALVEININDGVENIHGSFGKDYEWQSTHRNIVERWVTDNGNEIRLIISKTASGTKLSVDDKNRIEMFLNEEMLDRIDEIAQETTSFTTSELSEKLASKGILPMFGFPTNTRILYEERPEKLPISQGISRNLDVAISAFAPNSEIVKDKKVFKAAGFVHYRHKNGIVIEENALNEIPNGYVHCQNCNFLDVNGTNYSECPVCRQEVVTLAACSPLGFCVNYDVEPKDFEGRFEWVGQAGEIRLNYDGSNLKPAEPIGNVSIHSNIIPSEAQVFQINDNAGKQFLMGKVAGNSRRYLSQESVADGNVKLVNLKKYSLIARKTTGVLTIKPRSLNPMIDLSLLDRERPHIKAAMLSWGYLLRRAACGFMDIETSELDLGMSIRPNDDKYFGEIFLVEKLENGAGYCNYLSGRLDGTIPKLALLDPLMPGGSLFEVLMQDLHAQECHSSCYDCLRDYYNQNHHSILDWRLGLDIAAIAAAETYVPDFDSPYWVSHVDGLCNQMAKKHRLTHVVEKRRHLLVGNAQPIVITHPLWSKQMINKVIQELGRGYQAINLFDAIRTVRF